MSGGIHTDIRLLVGKRTFVTVVRCPGLIRIDENVLRVVFVPSAYPARVVIAIVGSAYRILVYLVGSGDLVIVDVVRTERFGRTGSGFLRRIDVSGIRFYRKQRMICLLYTSDAADE